MFFEVRLPLRNTSIDVSLLTSKLDLILLYDLGKATEFFNSIFEKETSSFALVAWIQCSKTVLELNFIFKSKYVWYRYESSVSEK